MTPRGLRGLASDRLRALRLLVAARRLTVAAPWLLVGSLLPLGLAGCAGQDRVVLLPSPDGHASRLLVTHGKTASELTTPYEQVAVSAGGTPHSSMLTAALVQQQFGATLAALPKAPITYALYFMGDSDELTDESKLVAAQVLAEIGKTPLAEVVIIGHTDTTGTQDYNDDLSLARATVVRDKLIRRGVAPERIEVAGRGERELMIKTPDETAEPRNRRVEIDVR